MRTIQLQKIITLQGLDPQALARELFPNHSYPVQAMDRVIKGLGLLNSDQVLKLSEITNIPVGFLYASGEWVATGTLNKISFVSGEVIAEVTPTPTKWLTKIMSFHKGRPFIQTTIHHSDIPAKVYLSELTDLIIKNSKNNK